MLKFMLCYLVISVICSLLYVVVMIRYSRKEENSKMNKGLIIALICSTVSSVVVTSSAITKIHKLQAEIISLEKKLADTEGANEVLVEQLKQLIGGR